MSTRRDGPSARGNCMLTSTTNREIDWPTKIWYCIILVRPSRQRFTVSGDILMLYCITETYILKARVKVWSVSLWNPFKKFSIPCLIFFFMPPWLTISIILWFLVYYYYKAKNSKIFYIFIHVIYSRNIYRQVLYEHLNTMYSKFNTSLIFCHF